LVNKTIVYSMHDITEKSANVILINRFDTVLDVLRYKNIYM